MEDFYIKSEAALKLGIDERTLQNHINKGELKAYRKGRRVYILKSDIVEFIKSGTIATDENPMIDKIKKNKPTEGL